MFQVKLTNRAEKDLKKLDQRFKIKVTQILENLSADPFLGEKMTGEYKGSYRVKIPPIRVIYSIEFESKIIFVKAVSHRQGIYK